MATLGDKLRIGDRQYEVIFVLEEPNTGLLRVAEHRSGCARFYTFHVPVKIWDAAVRGAMPFPTDQELRDLKADYDVSEDPHGHIAADYIKVLEGRVRELTFALEADQVDFEQGQSTALQGDDKLDELVAAERQDEGDR